MSPVGLVSLLTVFLHYEFLVLLIVIDFDFVFLCDIARAKKNGFD